MVIFLYIREKFSKIEGLIGDSLGKLEWETKQGFGLDNLGEEDGLVEKFPRLYNIFTQQNELVERMGHWREGI